VVALLAKDLRGGLDDVGAVQGDKPDEYLPTGR
jgi:hypothetical protein